MTSTFCLTSSAASGKPLVLAFSGAPFDEEILSLHVTVFAKASAERVAVGSRG